MSLNVDKNRQLAMQNVSVAVQYDGEGKSLEAYKKYVECIEFMAHQLVLDATVSEMTVSENTRKFVLLCVQCINRLSFLLDHVSGGQITNVSREEVGASDPPPSYAQSFAHDSVLSTTSDFNLPIHINSTVSSKKTANCSPLEMAHIQNERILAVHRARLEHMSPSSNQISTNLSLSVQRRMTENLAIARQRQIALEKKKQERLKRLLEETERRFMSRTGMSQDELERRKLFTEILEYEQDCKWLMELRRTAKDKAQDVKFVENSIHAILGTTDHPLTRLLHGYQYQICQNICETIKDADNVAQLHTGSPVRENTNPHALAGDSISTGDSDSDHQTGLAEGGSQDSLPSFTSSTDSGSEPYSKLTKHIQSCLENTETMFIVAYEDFDNATVRQCLRSCLEDLFFASIWQHILALFRLSTWRNEQKIMSVMKSCSQKHIEPSDVGVPVKLYMHDPNTSMSSGRQLPYLSVIEALRDLVRLTSPSKKIDCIVKASQNACQYVDDFYSSSGSVAPGVGADELLPILTYAIIKTEQPSLVTECQAILEFIEENSLMGEQGYCLTSVMTALDSVSKLNLNATN